QYYKDAPDLNQQFGGRERKSGFSQNADKGSNGKAFTRFHLNVGRRNGVLPENLISLINAVPGGGRIKVGKIEIMRNTATIEGDSRFIPQILGAFQHFQINGKPVTAKILHPAEGSGGGYGGDSRGGSEGRGDYRGRRNSRSNTGKVRKPWKGGRTRG
ncbi:MAG: hypothetical protein D3906_07265, partial [Candidatus Electrothrix sp. AUS1_2]|nr:hypothetical protein [Candidatus Electrothrix sp. AUS1_2]